MIRSVTVETLLPGAFISSPKDINPVLTDIDSTSIYSKNNRWKMDQSKIIADSNYFG